MSGGCDVLIIMILQDFTAHLGISQRRCLQGLVCFTRFYSVMFIEAAVRCDFHGEALFSLVFYGDDYEVFCLILVYLIV